MRTQLKDPVAELLRCCMQLHSCTAPPAAPVVENPVTVMKRYELKYIIDARQTEYLLSRLDGRMEPDRFGLTSIASLYYDTPDCRLIRASLEKPKFKEKLRLRSYGLATETSPVFLELKRKYDGVVYKRRLKTDIPAVGEFLGRRQDICGGQIGREMTVFRDYYGTLVPSCLIIYDRTAYAEPDGDLRLTIDRNPRYRTDGLDLTLSMDGTPLLSPGCSVLEIKVQSAMPLWLTDILSGGQIRKTSFSKYGEAYRRELSKLKRKVG